MFLVDHWQAIAFIIALVFNAGATYKMFKDKPSVEKMNKIIEDRFANYDLTHCPFRDRIESLTTIQIKNVTNIEHIQSKLDQINFNVQNICENFGVKYLGKKNGD